MQVQYSSARRSSSKQKVTLDGSGYGVWGSGVTLDDVLSSDFVGVQGSKSDGRGEPSCWARFFLFMERLNDEDKLKTRTSDPASLAKAAQIAISCNIII